MPTSEQLPHSWEKPYADRYTGNSRIDNAVAGALNEHRIRGFGRDCRCGNTAEDHEAHLASMVAQTIEPLIRRDERNRIAFAIVGREYDTDQGD